ncbi:hypothetical protein SESBI_48113 [Sesbania bispinosa]|nr:hypothetical protein SESBI_48113 [Sesbania bispinosa]
MGDLQGLIDRRKVAGAACTGPRKASGLLAKGEIASRRVPALTEQQTCPVAVGGDQSQNKDRRAKKGIKRKVDGQGEAFCAMAERARRMTPRRLSFNLDDFPETKGERIDLNTSMRNERPNDEPVGTHFVTPTASTVGGREELNLLSGLETPTLTTTKNDPQAVIPMDVLNNLIASQQSLVSLVTEHQDDAPVTQGELRRLLQAGKNSPIMTFDLEPPLAEEILAIPYPAGYQPPSFRKFDGASSAREHLMCFLHDLGMHRNNKKLRLMEFSKSLSGRAFTYRGNEETEKKSQGPESAYEICALEERERKRSFRNNQPMRRFTPQDVDDLLPLPINKQQACQLIEEWLKDGIIQPRVNKPPLPKEQYDDPSFCVLHCTRAHITIDCWMIRCAFQRQVRAGKVLLPEKEKEEEVEEESDAEDKALTTGIAKTRGFCILFGQLGLNQDAQQEAARALIRIVKNHGGELNAANAPLTRLSRSHAPAIVFREPCYKDLSSATTSLYITLSTFHGEPVESRVCVNAVLEGKEIEIQGVKASFEASESHLIDVALFDELPPPGSSQLEMEHAIVLQGRRETDRTRSTTRPTEALKRPGSKTWNGLEKEYLPNGEVRWRIL